MDFRIDKQTFSIDHVDDPKLPRPIPAAVTTISESDVAKIITQEIDTGTYRIVIDTLSFDDPVTLKANVAEDAACCLFFMLSGDGMSVGEGCSDVIPPPGAHNLFQVHPGDEWNVNFEEGEYQTFQVILPVGLIDQFKSHSVSLKKDIENLERLQKGKVAERALKTNPYSRRLIADVMACKYTGRRAAVYLSAICNELLMAFIFQFKSSQPIDAPLDNLLDYTINSHEQAAPQLDKFLLPCAEARVINDDYYSALLQGVRLADMTLGIHHFLVAREAGQRLYTKGPVFSLQCMYKADGRAYLANEEAPPLEEGEYFLFYLKEELSRRWFRRGEYVFINIEITPALLSEYCSYYPGAIDMLFLLPSLMSRHGEAARPLQYNKVVAGLLERILHCSYTGKIADIYLRPVCFQLLRHFLQQYMLERWPIDYRLVLNAGHKAVLETILDHADQLAVGSKDVKGIIQKYHIKEGVLDKLFWENYQVTIAGFIYRHRMEAAFRMLQGPDRGNLARIAKHCQYNSVKEFKKAFADYYNCEVEELFE